MNKPVRTTIVFALIRRGNRGSSGCSGELLLDMARCF